MFSFLIVSITASHLSERARRKTREALELQREKARLDEAARKLELSRQSEKFKSTLLDALAHELKTPLTALKASVSALRAARMAQKPAGDELLAIIEEETDRLTNLSSEVLRMARLDAGTLRLNREPCSAQQLVDDALASTGDLLEGRALDVSIEPMLTPLRVDRKLMQTALSHLLDNAAKYSSPGTPIHVRAWADNSHIEISVTDEGPGLPEAEITRIFDRFYRASSTANTVSGMGLGLAIARDITTAHGGAIWAQSSPAGTSFTVALPAERSA
jgi:two-component system sensor histidine kinase KdpD